MKHKFRIIIGLLLLAIPLSMTAQVKPVKPQKSQTEINEKEKAEAIRIEKEKTEKESQIKTQSATPQVKPTENPQPIEKPDKPEKDKPKLSDYIKLSGFAQAMYQANLSNEGELIDNNFSLRRVRLSVEGTLFQGLTYKIQGDFTRKPMLVDAYLKYKVCDEFAIQIGQFKTPFSIESPINPVNLEIFDYGEAIQGLVGYNDVCGVGSLGRDLGIMASGSLFSVKGKEGNKYHVVDYAIGVFNGNGANEKDNNNRKDIVGRLDIHPGLKALTLSGSYYYGKYLLDSINNGSRNRWSAGIQYNDGNLMIRAEYLDGHTGYQVAAFNDTLPVLDDLGNQVYNENLTNSKGYYAVVGYNFKLGKNKSQQLMPVFRYEHFTKDVSLTKSGTTYYTAGLSYWPIKYVNLKLNYQLIQTHNLIADDTYEKAFKNRVVASVNFKF